MKIWAFADTHGFHNQLLTPDGIDVAICAGDIANALDIQTNIDECLSFLDWYNDLDISRKLLIAGNHDLSFERKKISPTIFDKDLIYLEHAYSYGEINGLKIFGSPYTPAFNQWAFMKNRSKLSKYWEDIPFDVEILVVHGAPKGILDLSYDKNNTLEFCGDKALLNAIFRLPRLKYIIFGHIHNSYDIQNQGIRIIQGKTFMNVSCVTDNKFSEGLSSNGIVFEI